MQTGALARVALGVEGVLGRDPGLPVDRVEEAHSGEGEKDGALQSV